MNKLNILLCVPLLTNLCYAASAETNPKEYWKCSVQDSTHQEWVAQSSYERTAINKAFDACKKASKNPKSCTASKALCDHFINGRSTRPLWRCTALDSAANVWRSTTYPQKNDAALAAKAYCQQKSSVPSSCYVNLITCTNLNKQ